MMDATQMDLFGSRAMAARRRRKPSRTTDGYKTIRCPGCEQVKDRDAFPRDPSKPGGRHTYCRICRLARRVLTDRAYCGGMAEARAVRQGRMIAASDGSLTTDAVVRLVDKTDKCVYCGRDIDEKTMTIDHMDPLALGGLHSISNIVLCCRDCNSQKGRLSFMDWVEEIDAEFRGPSLDAYRKYENEILIALGKI